MIHFGRTFAMPDHARVPGWRAITTVALLVAACVVWVFVRPAASVPRAGPHQQGVAASRTSSTTTAPPQIAQPTPVTPRQAPKQAVPHAVFAASSLLADGIPTTAHDAYVEAARRSQRLDPGCGLRWPLLAGIGRVESDHGRFGGAVLHTDGLSTPRIIGIALDGHGTALVRDTDHGRLDGDRVFDRAVGPMQFIPSTWQGFAADGNGDGVADPFNIYDASAAAAHYLCVAGGDLTSYSGQRRAILAYNHSTAYLVLVLAVEKAYAKDAHLPLVTTPGPRASAPKPRPVPPANPGPPAALRKPPTPAPAPPSSASSSSSAPAVPSPTSSPSDPSSSSPAPSPTSSPSDSPSDSSSSSPAPPTSSAPATPSPVTSAACC